MKTSVFFLFVTTSLFAQDFEFDKDKGRAVPKYIAQIKLLEGKVFKLSNGEMEEVQVGARFSKLDTLVTSELSYAKIAVVDDTFVSIGPKSELKFSSFNFVDKTNRQITYDLIKGQLRAHVKNKAKEGEIIFKTKVTAMGVRGTEILINHQTFKNKEISEYALLFGVAEINDKSGKIKLIESDRVVFVQDPKTLLSANEKISFTKSEGESLKALKMNDEKEFKPFMPYFVPENVKQDSALYSFFFGTSSTVSDPADSTFGPKRDNKKNWRENLEKLNEKLRDNQKKTN
jgi:hypothetical protein